MASLAAPLAAADEGSSPRGPLAPACEDEAGDSLAGKPFEALTGAERRQLLKARAQERASSRKATRQAWELAEDQLRGYLSGSAYAEALAAAPRIPAWVQRVHPSHRGWYVGGLVVCSRCAAASASCDRRSLLSSGCRETCPHGVTPQVGEPPSGRVAC